MQCKPFFGQLNPSFVKVGDDVGGIGHALGLGHSTDSTSVMYATLNTGTVNRSLTTADLNVADSDTTGACGLHAAAIPIPVAEAPSILPTINAPVRDAFFVLLTKPVNAEAVASTAAFRSQARDAVFADPTADLGATKLAVLCTTPIFAAAVSPEPADNLFSDSLDRTDAPLTPAAPPSEVPDPCFDFIPANSTLDLEC